MEKGEDVLVSVSCITYNQKKYIKQALDGFVMQETNFKYEVIVHDDASTDGTADIVLEYANKYPDIIIPILEEKNVYRQKGFSGVLGVIRPYLKGKYIASCEGDDYWIDPKKLQKQVDFLEANADYSMCFHRAAVLDYIGSGSLLRCFDIEDRDYTSDELFEKWIVPTASVLRRRNILYPINNIERATCTDIFNILSCSHTGKVRGMSDVMSVYRIHTGGVTYDLQMQEDRIMRGPDHYQCIKDNFPKLSPNVINKELGIAYYNRAQIQTDKKLRKKDLKMVESLIPGYIKRQKLKNLKLVIKRVLLKLIQ